MEFDFRITSYSFNHLILNLDVLSPDHGSTIPVRFHSSAFRKKFPAKHGSSIKDTFESKFYLTDGAVSGGNFIESWVGHLRTHQEITSVTIDVDDGFFNTLLGLIAEDKLNVIRVGFPDIFTVRDFQISNNSKVRRITAELDSISSGDIEYYLLMKS